MIIINVKNKKYYKGEGFYIGRPGPLSNPFRITGDMTREKSIEKYGLRLIEKIKKNDPIIITALEKILSYLLKYNECNLICWCAPEPCHGDIISQVLLNKIHTGNWLVDDKVGLYMI